MVKTLKLPQVTNIFKNIRLVKKQKNGWVYDKTWKMTFVNEEERQEFLKLINERIEEANHEENLIPLEELIEKVKTWTY